MLDFPTAAAASPPRRRAIPTVPAPLRPSQAHPHAQGEHATLPVPSSRSLVTRSSSSPELAVASPVCVHPGYSESTSTG